MQIVIIFLSTILSFSAIAEIVFPKIRLENSYKVIKGEIFPKKHDADSFIISNMIQIRLLGIDAFEWKQTCKNSEGKDYNCGKRATEYLKKLTANQPISCRFYGKKDNTSKKRLLVKCFSYQNENLGLELVKAGWAISAYNQDYKKAEKIAKKNKKGAWNGTFINPKKFRNKKN